MAPTAHDAFLRTDHLKKNLRERSVSATFVTGIAQGSRFVLTLLSTIILARLLTPEEFGLVAMVTTVTSFLRVFKDAGLSIATVQKEDITHAQVSNLFWINVVLSGSMTLLMAAMGPALAWFYRDPRLVGITLFLSVTFLLSGCMVQHQALLNRQMRFKAIAAIEITSMVASLGVGIAMAALGWGYWSLVGSAITLEAVGLALTWTVSRWRPQWPSRRSGTRPLLNFGANLTLGNFVFFLARGVDTLLLGRFYGADAVGLYSRAMALLMRPLEQFLSPISTVFVPVLSRLQSDSERYRRAFLQINESIAIIGFLFTGLVLALAHPITLVLLGPRWESAAVVFGGFVFAALYAPLSITATWLFTSQGRGKDVLVSNSVLSILTVLSFVGGLPYGPVGVAFAFSVSGLLIRLPILYYIAGRRGPIATRDLWHAFFRHLPVWVVVFGSTWACHQFLPLHTPLAQMIACAPIGLIVGFAWIWLWPHHRRVALNILGTVKTLRERA